MSAHLSENDFEALLSGKILSAQQKEHLNKCSFCAKEMHMQREADKTLGQLAVKSVNTNVYAKVMQRVNQQVKIKPFLNDRLFLVAIFTLILVALFSPFSVMESTFSEMIPQHFISEHLTFLKGINLNSLEIPDLNFLPEKMPALPGFMVYGVPGLISLIFYTFILHRKQREPLL